MKKIFTIITLTIGFVVSSNAQGITNTLGGNTANDKFLVENSNSEAGLIVTGEGKVGISIPTPHAKLHVISTTAGGADNTAKFEAHGIGNNASHIHYGTNGDWYIRSAKSDGKVIIQDSGGNVGIGTTNPICKLSVGGDGENDATIYGETTETIGFGVFGMASNIGVASTYGGYFVSKGYFGRGVYGVGLGTNGQGVVGGGAAYDFYAIGSGVDYGASSSIRWKTNIVEIDNPLDKLAKLRGVYFDWDEEHGGQHDVGCIAEEVGKVLPEIVVYEENGIDADGMDYSKLTPLLVEAVKELRQIVEAQQKRIDLLEGK